MSVVRVAKAAAVIVPTSTSVVRVAKAQVASAGGSKVRVARAYATSVGSLVANAGPALSVSGLDTVVLDGSASSAGTGSILQWDWSQDTAYGGPTITLTNTDQRIASFTAPGVLFTGTSVRIRLRVRDASGFSPYSYAVVTVARHRTFRSLSAGGFAAYKTVGTAIPAVNQAPVAVIGPDQSIQLGQTATIGGTDSDVDGTVMSRTFTVVSGPSVPLLSGTGDTRTLTPTVAGSYVLQKIVVDDKGLSSNPVRMTLTVTSAADPFVIGTTRPDATNVGRNALSSRGAFVRVNNGDWNITTPGLYEDIDVTGSLKISVSNVTVRYSRVRGRTLTNGAGYNLLFIAPGLTNVLVEFCDIYFEPAVGIENDQAALTASYVYSVNGMQAQCGTVRRCNIHHACDTAQIFGSAVTVEANYYHQNIHLDADPGWSGTGSHDDGIQIEGGNGHIVRGNTVEGGYNGGIIITQNVTTTTNLQIVNNWLGGGGATLNFAEKARGPFTGLRVTGNRFLGTSRLAGFDILIPATSYDTGNPTLNSANNNVLTPNTKLADGSPAAIHKG